MTDYRTLLVLANSVKKNARCIAGREIVSRTSHYEIGGWIRPITDHDEGAVFPSESVLHSGKQPKVMQFVQVPLTRHMPDESQPENWMIASGKQWTSVNHLYQQPDMSMLVQTPTQLWQDPACTNDRISVVNVQPSRTWGSLYLIYVRELVISFGWRDGKKRRRAEFAFNGVNYDFGMTDPDVEVHYGHYYPPQNKPAFRFYANQQKPCYVCVSLTPPFRGFHYKVVATVFEV